MKNDLPNAYLASVTPRAMRRLGRRNVVWGSCGFVLVLGAARLLLEFPKSPVAASVAFVVLWFGVVCFFGALVAALAKFTLGATLRSATWTPCVGGHVPIRIGPLHFADGFFLDDPAYSFAGWTRPITKAELPGYQDPEVWIIRRSKRRFVVSPPGGSAPRYLHRIRNARVSAWIQRRAEEAPRGVVDVTDFSS